MGAKEVTPFLQLTPAAAKRIWDRLKWKPAWWTELEKRRNPVFDPAILAGRWTFVTEETNKPRKDP